VNTYWRRKGNAYFVGEAGKRFRKNAMAAILKQHNGYWVQRSLGGPLSARLDLFPPDKRERDIDNYSKGVFDTLEDMKVFYRDSQIKKLEIQMHAPVGKPGRCELTILELDDA
jgi:crossover junction endodeoxyribonuclease RusA